MGFVCTVVTKKENKRVIITSVAWVLTHAVEASRRVFVG
jgi:hypothetical protein